MHLYILRHANADTEASADDARELSAKGFEQAEKAAQFCERQGLLPEVIFCSPLIRAQQTAKPVAQIAGLEITTAPWLESGATAEGICAALAAQKKWAAAMIVGHEPDLGKLIAHLLGSADGSITVRKASLTRLIVESWKKGGGQLEFSIPARMMARD